MVLIDDWGHKVGGKGSEGLGPGNTSAPIRERKEERPEGEYGARQVV
jgi:hypothetical protein